MQVLQPPHEVWDTWHKLEAPPPDTGKSGYGQRWLQWAVARFRLFRDAPQPLLHRDMGDWVRLFDRWGLPKSETTTHLVRVVLDYYNDDARWKCPRARSIAQLARRLDDGNRRGLAALILHAKGF